MSTQQVEAQLNYFHTLTARSIASAEQIIALNLSTVRASMEKSSAAMQQLFTVKDPRDLLAFTTSTQENFDSLMAYGRKLSDIASGIQASVMAPEADPFEAPAAPAAPVKKAVLAAEPAPEPVALPVEAKPIVKEVKKVVAKAAPFPTAEPKQLDMLVPKPKAAKKK